MWSLEKVAVINTSVLLKTPLDEETIKQSEIMDGDKYMHFTVKLSNVF